MGAARYLRCLRQKWQALCSRRDGVAATEFALVAFPLFFLVFVILETGYFYIFSILLNGAAAEGARQVRTGVVQQELTLELRKAALKKRVCDNVFLIKCGDLIFDVRNFDDFPSSQTDPPDALPETQELAKFEPGNPGSTVIVRVIYPWSFMTPLIEGLVDVKQMIATVAFRNEPY